MGLVSHRYKSRSFVRAIFQSHSLTLCLALSPLCISFREFFLQRNFSSICLFNITWLTCSTRTWNRYLTDFLPPKILLWQCIHLFVKQGLVTKLIIKLRHLSLLDNAQFHTLRWWSPPPSQNMNVVFSITPYNVKTFDYVYVYSRYTYACHLMNSS
jgi:hypothetical protein